MSGHFETYTASSSYHTVAYVPPRQIDSEPTEVQIPATFGWRYVDDDGFISASSRRTFLSRKDALDDCVTFLAAVQGTVDRETLAKTVRRVQ